MDFALRIDPSPPAIKKARQCRADLFSSCRNAVASVKCCGMAGFRIDAPNCVRLALAALGLLRALRFASIPLPPAIKKARQCRADLFMAGGEGLTSRLKPLALRV